MASSAAKVDQSSTPYRKIHKIGLISPCGWGNLGNVAIMSAMIANIYKRITDAEILGITSNPSDTCRRHKITAIPLSGLHLSGYGVSHSDGSKTLLRQDGILYRLRHRLKKFPLLFNFLQALRNTTRMLVREAIHIGTTARVTRRLDMIIIPGGGALDEFWGGPWGHPWTLFKWALMSRVCGVPLLFVSVGKSSLERPLSRFFVGIALHLSEYRSYRDSDSKLGVQDLLDVSHDPVYPDLAFSYPCPVRQSSDNSGLEDGQLMVGVSPIAYCDPRAWPYKDEQRYATYLKRMAEMVLWLLRERYRVLFFATDSPDVMTIKDIFAMLVGGGISANMIETLPSPVELSTDDLLRGICRADLIIASRLHGVILSHLNTIPVLALSYDPKVVSHMKAVEQMDYCLDIDHLMPKMLMSTFRDLKAFRKREQAHLYSAVSRFRHLLDLQYDQILGHPKYPEKQDRS